jgi:accessory gene regulator B
MNKYLNRIAAFLVNNEKSKKLNLELYKYALKLIAHAFINIITTVVIGLFFNMLVECLSFYATFFILRKFTGGLHAHNYIHCLFFSVIMIFVSLYLIKYCELYNHDILFVILVVFSSIAIGIFSPLDNKNKQLSNRERQVYKSVSISLSILITLATLVLLRLNLNIAYSIGMGIVVVSVLLIFAVLKMAISRRKV